MKVSTLSPLLALFTVLAFTSCSSESLNKEENLTLEIVVPTTKPIEVEVLNFY